MKKSLMLLLLLTGCANTVETSPEYIKFQCAPVKSCQWVKHEIVTNKDLALAYSESIAQIRQCRAAQDTLLRCIRETNDKIDQLNH